jgi:hypothetical protein
MQLKDCQRNLRAAAGKVLTRWDRRDPPSCQEGRFFPEKLPERS